ncbi:MAG: GNAT family N-acetyltransferase [Halobacteriaceae archaeon]
MSVRIRKAVPEDATVIRDLHIASIEGLAGGEYNEEQVEAWAHDRDPSEYPITNADAYVVVAELDDQIVGFGQMKPDADDYFQATVDGEITAIYIHPSVARQGIGTRIYDELEAEARRNDVESLGLWASLNAVSFYETQGYQRIIEHTHEFSAGVEGTVVEMKKILS